MRLYELFDSGDLDYYEAAALFTAETKFSNGKELDLTARKMRGVWVVDFSVGGSTTITDAGNEFEVFGAVMTAMTHMADYYKPHMMYFSSKGSSRTSLYRRLVKRIGSGMQLLTMDYAGDTNFFLYRQLPDIKTHMMRIDNRARYSFPMFDKSLIVNVSDTGGIEFDSALVAFLKTGNSEVVEYLKSIIRPVLPESISQVVAADSETESCIHLLY